MKKFFASAVFGLLALAVFLPKTSFAITVGPDKLEYTLAPGATVTGTLFVLNEGTTPQTLTPSFETFTETNGTKQFSAGTPSDLTNWFVLPSSTTLAAGESENIPFTLNVPQGAPAGGHFAVIWWNTAPAGAGMGDTSIVTRAGVLVYLNVTGQIDEAASVTHFAPTGGGHLFDFFPTNFDITFSDTGNDYLQPVGNIVIKDMFGLTDATFSVNKDGGEQILPQSAKDLPVTVESPSGAFGFGVYRAELALHYGQTNQEIDDSYTFVVITWQVVLLILIVLLLVLFGIARGVRKYNQWVIRKATAGLKVRDEEERE
jgi:hypothetical protein